MNALQQRARMPRLEMGMTLVELMISITIGLFIIGAALMVFQSTSGIGRQISEVAQLRQQGATAFRVIAKQVSEAGSVEPDYNDENNNFRFADKFTWTGSSAIANWTPPTGTDFLSISQQVQTSSDYQALLRNCLGQTVKKSGSDDTTRSSFYIKPVSGKSYGELMCETGANDGGQPIISNVAAFKVRYRVRPSATNITAKQFVDNPINWGLVDAVEVCLDLVGDRNTPTDDSTYTDCDGDSTVSRGNRLHVVQRSLFTVYSAQR